MYMCHDRASINTHLAGPKATEHATKKEWLLAVEEGIGHFKAVPNQSKTHVGSVMVRINLPDVGSIPLASGAQSSPSQISGLPYSLALALSLSGRQIICP